MGADGKEVTESGELNGAFVDFENLKQALGPEVVQLWSDAFDYLREARPSRPHITPERRMRLARSAVLTAAAAFEAVTNFLAERVAEHPTGTQQLLSEFEIDCLRERRRVLEAGVVREKKQIYSSKDRFLLVLRILSGSDKHNEAIIMTLEESILLRDRLVHPKPHAPVDVLANDSWSQAFMGFLAADLILARAWAQAKSLESAGRKALAGS